MECTSLQGKSLEAAPPTTSMTIVSNCRSVIIIPLLQNKMPPACSDSKLLETLSSLSSVNYVKLLQFSFRIPSVFLLFIYPHQIHSTLMV